MISKIRIPNLKEALMLTVRTIARFPLATLCGILGTIVMCYYIDVSYQDDDLQKKLMRIVMVCGLGISYFTALQLIGENLKSRILHYAIKLVGLALLVLYYFSLPDEMKVIHGVRFVLFGIVTHLLVSFAPFIVHFNKSGFWSYNKQLFLQILTAFFFSMVLFAGLALALLAIENLFDVDINAKNYSKLFFIITGIFSMLYFLGGVPRREEVFEDEGAYSKGLSIFTQYILIPLVSIYNIILYLYTLKIIVQWDWPRGWIAYLFVSYAVLGILSYLLIYPMANEKTKVWLKTFSKSFFISLIPLVVVLFLAVYRRTAEYGLTENRYFLFVLDFWLFGIAAYFIFSKAKNIKLIPVTLAIVILLASFGPWGAFSMSTRNQVNRFEKLMDEKVKGSESIKFEDKKNLSSILTYLHKREGLDKLQPYFKQDIDSLSKIRHADVESILLDEYNLNYINEWATEDNDFRKYISFGAKNNYHTNVEHKEFLRFDNYTGIERGLQGISIDLDKENLMIDLSDSTGWKAQINVEPLIQNLVKLHTAQAYDMDPEDMLIKDANSAISYSIYFKSIYVDRQSDGRYQLQNATFDLFFTRKK